MATKSAKQNKTQSAVDQYTASNPVNGTGGGSIPTYSPTSTGPQPLGVGADYRAPTDIPNFSGDGTSVDGTVKVSPAYFAGAQWGTVPDFPTDTSGIIQLQQMLMQAGFLNPKQVIVGQWDSTSAAAFAQVLASANQRGTDWKTALARSLSTADQTAALQASARAPEVTHLANPDDIKAAGQSAARSLYGGDLTPEEEQHFVASFQGMQAQAHHAAYMAGDPNATGDYSGTGVAGGTVTDAPSLSTAALNEVNKDHPDQVFVSALGAALKNVTQSIGTPGGGFL